MKLRNENDSKLQNAFYESPPQSRRLNLLKIMAKLTLRQSYFLIVLVPTALAFVVTSEPSILSSPNPLPPTNPRCISNITWSSRHFEPRDCFAVLLRYQAKELVDEHGRIIPIEFLARGAPGKTAFKRVLTPRKYYFGMPCTSLVWTCDQKLAC